MIPEIEYYKLASKDLKKLREMRYEMTKSQKNEQLTEQWKKGELEKCKDYYVKYGDYEMSLTLDGDNDFIFYGRPIKPKVLAPVPSYEEWQASEKYNKHLEEVIKIYERKDKQATETSIAYNELLEENEKLKELLKECKEKLKYCTRETYELLNKIDAVLK